MIWLLIIFGFLLLGGLGELGLAIKNRPLSPYPTEFAKILGKKKRAWPILYNLSHSGFGKLKYAYLYEYISAQQSKYSSKDTIFIRDMVWNFKEGCYDEELVYRIADLIMEVAGNSIRDKVFICIPASSEERYQLRFMDFSRKICALTGMRNGFDWIMVKFKRKQTHLTSERALPRWEDSIECVEWQFYKTRVILFDDLLTTGKSYGSFKKYLENRGAIVECGIFLAMCPKNC